MSRLLTLWKNDDVRGGAVFILLFVVTLFYDRFMDLAFGVYDWNEILDLNMSWQNMVPYWRAMWVFYFPALLFLFSFACRSLLPILWGTVTQVFGIHDYSYFLILRLKMPARLSYLNGTPAWQLANMLGFEELTPSSLAVTSFIGILVGISLSAVYLHARRRLASLIEQRLKSTTLN